MPVNTKEELDKCIKITDFIVNNAYDLDTINSTMSKLDINNLSLTELVTWLRATFIARDKLPAWKDLYAKTNEHHSGNSRIKNIMVSLS